MEKRKLELLSPARNYEIAKAAIDCGADAVYIGYEKFGARSVATNSLENIKKVVDYAHLFGVRVYVTMNTLLFDQELNAAKQAVNELYEAKVDAIIVQDMAYLQFLNVPIQLHGSTQMNCFTKEKLKFLYDTGIDRVVLPREFSIEEIRRMHEFCPEVELEAFIHGALCCSISGQCYLSLYQTQRSGNRGVCSQSCRSRYDLINQEGKVLKKDKYLLSTKDFNASAYLAEMIQSGVCSFKIEGRLKDITYVKNVTSYYNKLLNEFIENNPQYARSSFGEVTQEFKIDIDKSFNRGYTSFFLNGRKEVTGNIDTTKSIGKYVGEVLQSKANTLILKTDEVFFPSDGLIAIDQNGISEGFLVNAYAGNQIKINKSLNLKKGTKIFRNKDTQFEKQLSGKSIRKLKVDITLSDNYIEVSDKRGKKSKKYFLNSKEKLKNSKDFFSKTKEKFSKMGDTVFELDNFTYNCQEEYFFPASFLNSLRRDVLESLQEEILNSYSREKQREINFSIPYIKKEVDYTENISNEESKAFYANKGVEIKEYALEKQMKQGEICLMRSRNCIRYNLGQCLKRHVLKKEYQSELFLKDNNHKYRLKFDCENCLMEVYS
ncbi:MAG: U32 family peptidase [Bacteroidales bacterium]|nr:U32 family peptidase [Bacteroidales bacterium]